MALDFITGAPGSGKTTVTREMLGRGFNVFDTDDPQKTGIAGWYNIQTGEYYAGFNEVPVTEDLTATHLWRLSDEAQENFRARSEYESIYLCGRLKDAKSVIEMSRGIFFLTVPGAVIKQRLTDRAKISGEVQWGHETWQVERSVVVNRELEEEYRKLGAVMIDATQPVARVVDDIIDATTSK